MRRAEIPQAIDRALRLYQAGQLEPAEKIYRDILQLDDNHAQAHHFLGLLLHQRAANEEAVTHLNRSIALSPDNVSFRANAVAMYSALGLHEQAIEKARLVLARSPEHADT